VHEVYFKATPARGNGHDDVTNCHQETTTIKKEAAALWSSQSAAHGSVEANDNKCATMNNNRKMPLYEPYTRFRHVAMRQRNKQNSQ
jgi:hypothetical protein